LSFIDGEFIVNITNPMIVGNVRFRIKHLYEDGIIRMLYSILKTKVETYTQLEVDVPKILIKSGLKSRWASLTRKGSINFNMHFLKAPQDVVDYIILHELCHLKVEGHSHHYWDLLHKFMPNYYDKVEWLKVNGNNLL